MSAMPAKFSFDVDMSARQERRQSVSEDRLNQLLAEARQEGVQQGRIEGEQAATARAAEALANAANALATKASQMMGQIDAHNKKTLTESVGLAATIAEKLVPHLIAREPAAELEALLLECLATIDSAPHLVVRCHPGLADAIKVMADEKTELSGFRGRLIIMGEPDIALGDGRIEWADGGIIRDSETIAAEIETRINAYLKAKGAPTLPAGEIEE